MDYETKLEKAVEAQTPEQVDKEFSKFMNVMRYGEDSKLVIIARAKDELNIIKVAKKYGLGTFSAWDLQSQSVQICCPFHDDKNPSCSLWSDVNVYRCWSCGARGDLVKFIQHLEEEDTIPYNLLRSMLQDKGLRK
jgi:hypothetical protein